MYFLYSVLLGAALALLSPYFLLKGLRRNKYLHSLGARLGAVPEAARQTAPGAVWVHAVSVGEALAVELRARTGIETVHSELTYDLRSGEPDSLDQMVATTFANVAMDLLTDGITGRMTAIVDGKYAHVPLPDPARGPRRVDVAVNYNAERFRPRYDGRLGESLLLA